MATWATLACVRYQLIIVCGTKFNETGSGCTSSSAAFTPMQRSYWFDFTGKVCFLLQKSLLENCQSRVDRRGELKSLKNNCEKAQQKLQEKETELAAARAENQTLRLQVVLGTHLWLKPKAK